MGDAVGAMQAYAGQVCGRLRCVRLQFCQSQPASSSSFDLSCGRPPSAYCSPWPGAFLPPVPGASLHNPALPHLCYPPACDPQPAPQWYQYAITLGPTRAGRLSFLDSSRCDDSPRCDDDGLTVAVGATLLAPACNKWKLAAEPRPNRPCHIPRNKSDAKSYLHTPL